ncbi:MAG: hypothetical protein EBT86_06305 [Actinobacteria bacterium]|nr:hypothetical protein [Actinomycetota bacterium]
MGLSQKVPKRTRKTRKSNRGGAYVGVLRPEHTKPLDDLTIKYICSHGEISPEIFYVVPQNVYILMPNVCGVATSVTQTIADPIYQTKEESDRIFRQKFITGEMSGGTQFTVFCPGDIIPMQTFIFSPLVGRGKEVPDSIYLGFVGIFDSGALINNPLYRTIKDKRVFDNIFSLNIRESRQLVFDLLNTFREHFRQLKEKGEKPSGNLWGLYRAVTSELYRTSVTTDDLLRFNSKILFSNPEISRLPEYYRKTATIYDNRIKEMGSQAINYLLAYLLPLIFENQIAEYLSEKYLENIKSKNSRIPNISLKTVVDLTKSSSKTSIFVVNACRSLLERSFESFESESEATGATGAAAAAAALRQYDMPNTGKYSSELISKIDELNRNIGGDPLTAFNMNNINEIRRTVGLRNIKQDVFTYDELLRILTETIGNIDVKTNNSSVAIALAPYTTLVDRLRIALDKLEKYAPIEEIRATRAVRAEASAAAASAAAAEMSEYKMNVTTRRTELEKEIESLRKLVVKLKLNVKYNKSGAVKIELKEKQERLKELKAEIEKLV